jgi:hypothetical protein
MLGQENRATRALLHRFLTESTDKHFNLGGGFGYFGGGQFLTNVTTSRSYTYYYFAQLLTPARLNRPRPQPVYPRHPSRGGSTKHSRRDDTACSPARQCRVGYG